MQRSRVVLPQPDGPTIVTISRSLNVRVDVLEYPEIAVILPDAVNADARTAHAMSLLCHIALFLTFVLG